MCVRVCVCARVWQDVHGNRCVAEPSLEYGGLCLCQQVKAALRLLETFPYLPRMPDYGASPGR